MSAQPTSLFFCKLPLDVRRLIYAYALGGREMLFQVISENVGDERGKEKLPFKLICTEARGLLAFPKSCNLA
jgi:hypothetical protein